MILLFTFGIVLLILGGELFVTSSVSMAALLRVPRILIGTTLVSLATTAPEVAVSATASWRGQPGLAIGNAVGSAIANIGLILGLLCVLRPMDVKPKDFGMPSWVMLAMGVLVTLLTIPLRVERWAGVLLLACAGSYLLLDYRRHRPRPGVEADTVDSGEVDVRSLPVSIVLFVLGAGMVLAGSRLLCTSGVRLAEAMGISPIVIGLTLVAFGTSVPELATALAAARKGVPDLSLGNVIGANILNLTLVTGTAASINPLVIQHRAQHLYNFPAMLVIFVLLLVMGRTGKRLTRGEGWVFLVTYAVYIIGLLIVRQ